MYFISNVIYCLVSEFVNDIIKTIPYSFSVVSPCYFAQDALFFGNERCFRVPREGCFNFRRAEGWQFLFLCAEQGIIKRAGIWRSSYFIEGGMFQSAEGALF